MSPSSNHDLTQRFQNLLNKLSNPSTKNIATKQLEQLIQDNQSSDDLQTYLWILQQNQRTNNSKQSQMEVLVIGYITSIYQDRLRIKEHQKDDHIYTAFQFIKIIIGCLKYEHESIVDCCFKSLSMLYLNSLQSVNIRALQLIMVDPFLIQINSGSDLVVQLNSSRLLNMIFRMLNKYNQYDLLYHISTKFISIFMKLGQSECKKNNYLKDNQSLNNPLINHVTHGMRILIQSLNLNRFNNMIHKIVNKTIKNINISQYQSLLLLTTIGQLYLNDPQQNYMIGIDYQQITDIMQKQKRTNQQNIQQIAQQGQAIWKQIGNSQQQQQKQQRNVNKSVDVDIDQHNIHQEVIGQYYQKQNHNQDIQFKKYNKQIEQDVMDQVDVFNIKKQYLHKNKQKQTKGYSHQEQQQKIQNYIQKMRIMNMNGHPGQDQDQNDYIDFNHKTVVNKIKKEQIESDQQLNQFRKQQQVQVDLDDTIDMNDQQQQEEEEQNYEQKQYKISKNFIIDDNIGEQNKYQQQQQQNQSVSQQWQDCLSLLNESPDKSFKNTLSLNDDLYLLRLCLIYQQQQQQPNSFLQKLSTPTAVELIQRLSRLQQSRLVEQLVIKFYRLIISKVGLNQLSIEQRHNIIDSMKEIRSRSGVDQQSIDELIQQYS